MPDNECLQPILNLDSFLNCLFSKHNVNKATFKIQCHYSYCTLFNPILIFKIGTDFTPATFAIILLLYAKQVGFWLLHRIAMMNTSVKISLHLPVPYVTGKDTDLLR